MRDLTPILIGLGGVWLILQVQKTQKGGDTYITERSGAETRAGRIADQASGLYDNVVDAWCDNVGWFCEG